MKNLLTVSIGVTAFNEENNIRKHLISILKQREKGFCIKEIIVVSDASTDKTVDKIKAIKDKRIALVEGKVRRGQNVRYNNILKQTTTDIIVFLEADTILKNDSYLAQLIEPFRQDPNVSLTYGSSFPVPASEGAFFGKMLIFVESLKENMLRRLSPDSLYFCGSGKALVRSRFQNFSWPSNVPEDAYIYLYSKKKKLKTLDRPAAVVLYKSPANFWDYAKKSSRFYKGKDQLEKYFSQEMLVKSYQYPKKWLWTFLIKGIYLNPIYMIAYIFISLSSKIYKLFTPEFTNLWSPSQSTKILK